MREGFVSLFRVLFVTVGLIVVLYDRYELSAHDKKEKKNKKQIRIP